MKVICKYLGIYFILFFLVMNSFGSSNNVPPQQLSSEKSKTRARVEHVFGFMEQSMKGLVVRSVGMTKARGIIGLINLTYNLFRYEQVIRLNILTVK